MHCSAVKQVQSVSNCTITIIRKVTIESRRPCRRMWKNKHNPIFLNISNQYMKWNHKSCAVRNRLTWDWSKWMMTFRSGARSTSEMAVPAAGSRSGEKQACSHSVHVIIWTLCIHSSLTRNILLRKSLTSWSFMASSSWRPTEICQDKQSNLNKAD